jgi:Ca2+-binding EF-hand superfamily protein
MTYEEFYQLFKYADASTTDDVINLLWEMADKDDSNTVSRKEFHRIMGAEDFKPEGEKHLHKSELTEE